MGFAGAGGGGRRAAAGWHVLAERESRGLPRGIQFNLRLGGTFGRRAEAGRGLHGGGGRSKATEEPASPTPPRTPAPGPAPGVGIKIPTRQG